MNKVLIIGSCGAGKSIATKNLAKIVNLPIIHLDLHYWKPNWVKSEKNEWFNKVKELCAQPQWIMDGNYGSTMDYRLEQADTVIFLLYPRFLCLTGIFKRLLVSPRVDKIPGCREKIDWEFIRYVWTYNKIQAPKIIKKAEKLKDKQIFILQNRKQLENLFSDIKTQ